MDKWECKICHYIYDPQIGEEEFEIKPNTLFEDIDIDFTCPICCSPKEFFVLLEPEDY